jgi:excisionase family DNA binding protein
LSLVRGLSQRPAARDARKGPPEMTTDADGLALLFAALGAIPERLTALERETAAMREDVGAIREALPPRLVSPADAARCLAVSLPTIRRWVKAGRVPVVKVGNTVRVDLSRLHGADDLTVARTAQQVRAGHLPGSR